jgi:glucose-6-phosphate 1-dehydrogenase
METRAVPLAFSYEEQLGPQSDAYERLLGDALGGRQALFARQDGVEECWRIIEPVLARPEPVIPYGPGSWGPAEADTLLASGHTWHEPADIG